MQATYHITGTNSWPQAQGGCNYTSPPGSCPYGAFTRTPSNVSFDNTQGLWLERNTFTHLGAGGLFVGPHTNNTTVDANVFNDISGTGLAIGDVQDDTPVYPSILPTNTTVTNNWVTNVGEDYKGAVGIFQGYAVNSLIQHNQINEVPYTGLSINWNWGRSSSPSSRNVVRANLIFDHLQYLTDGGAIYMVGPQGPNHTAGLLTDYNVIHAQGAAGHALYTDGGSEHITLDHNVIYDNSASGTSDWGGFSDGNPATYAQQLVADLGASKTVNEVRVLMPATTFATNFHLDFSPNATSYTTAATVNTVGVGGEVQVVLPNAPVTGRYVRVVADLPNGVNQRGGQMGISELTVLPSQ